MRAERGLVVETRKVLQDLVVGEQAAHVSREDGDARG